MMAKGLVKQKRAKPPQTEQPPAPEGVTQKALSRERLKTVGGSDHADWNTVVANQVIGATWISGEEDKERRDKLSLSSVGALASTSPQDTIEGLLLAQLIASHNAAMECHRRAMHPQQSFEGRGQNLSQANKLSRTAAALVDALSRYRSQGEQKITVQHVNVASGGQAIVGVVETGGAGANQIGRQCHAGAITADALMPKMLG